MGGWNGCHSVDACRPTNLELTLQQTERQKITGLDEPEGYRGRKQQGHDRRSQRHDHVPVPKITLEARISGGEVRHHTTKSIQLAFLILNLRAVLITQCEERRDLCLDIGYPMLIANSDTLMFLRVGIPESPDRLEMRNSGLLL